MHDIVNFYSGHLDSWNHNPAQNANDLCASQKVIGNIMIS